MRKKREQEMKKLEEERKMIEEEKRKRDEERKKLEEEKQRIEEERRLIAEEKKKREEERKRLEQEKLEVQSRKVKERDEQLEKDKEEEQRLRMIEENKQMTNMLKEKITRLSQGGTNNSKSPQRTTSPNLQVNTNYSQPNLMKSFKFQKERSQSPINRTKSMNVIEKQPEMDPENRRDPSIGATSKPAETQQKKAKLPPGEMGPIYVAMEDPKLEDLPEVRKLPYVFRGGLRKVDTF
jgi:DNA repair exonuclease SbcCD ATPase subunit